MTVEHCRKILGQDIQSLTDQEVTEMVQRDSSFMEVLLELLTKNPLGVENGTRCD